MPINADFKIQDPDFPIIATALHDGHDLRDEVARLSALNGLERLREEDPFTGQWTTVSDNQIIVNTSRFEVDLNRVKHEAVYVNPEDAWGLNLWKEKPGADIITRSLAVYDDFYEKLNDAVLGVVNRCQKIVVFDFHSYNHLRSGPDGPPADPEKNPEVNIGTGTMNRKKWANIVDRFIAELSAFDYLGRSLDVRENVKFWGRQFAQTLHDDFPDSVCVLSVELKKFFMNEWTGKPDQKQLDTVLKALESTIPGILEELKS